MIMERQRLMKVLPIVLQIWYAHPLQPPRYVHPLQPPNGIESTLTWYPYVIGVKAEPF